MRSLAAALLPEPPCGRGEVLGRKQLWFDYFREVARLRGGALVSARYEDMKTKLTWRCAKGHRWPAAPRDIRQGTWCPTCAPLIQFGATRELNLERCRLVAKSHGGQCLSKRYESRDAPMHWRCARGHRWTTSARPILERGHWCPTCGHVRRGWRRRNTTFRLVQAIARRKGGACLSSSYDHIGQKLEFRCAEGHHWSTRPSLVRGGAWCKKCSGTESVRDLKEAKFKAIKALARRRGGVCLSQTYANAHAKLSWRCAEGHEWRASAHSIDRTWCPRCAGVTRLTLQALQARAKERGGVCLADTYRNTWSKVPWRCSAGHTWWATPSNVMHQGTWCPTCHGLRNDQIERMRAIARRHRGRLLSDEYVDAATALLWRCAKGHEWWSLPANVKRNSWCPECRGRRSRTMNLTLEDMKATAAERGGECLSRQYFDTKRSMKWKCARGHVWTMSASSVRRGSWCKRCNRSVIGTIQGLKAWALELGGRCISEAYDDPRVPLSWQCAKRHRFEALASAVKSGVWCPRCAKQPTASPRRPMGTGQRKPEQVRR